MLNSIETNKFLISKSYTEFKACPTASLLSKSYHDFNRQFNLDTEKSLYEFDSVRRLLTDMEEESKCKDLEQAATAAACQEPQSSTFINEKTIDEDFLANIDPIKDKHSNADFNYSDNESTNTSYQELPSISASKTTSRLDENAEITPLFQDEEAAKNPLENISSIEKDDTALNSNNNLPVQPQQGPPPPSVKAINLNTSLQSLTSQCTIDSLAKRVQKLVGPVDYNRTSTYTHHTICNKPSTISGGGGLAAIDASRHSLINYDSIYKELDSIQDTLRGQTSFNKHLDTLASTAGGQHSYETKYQSHNESINSLNSKYKSLSKFDFANVGSGGYDEKNSYFEEASKNISSLKSDLAEIGRIKSKPVNNTSTYKFSETLATTPVTTTTTSTRDQASKNYLTTSVTRMNTLSTPLLSSNNNAYSNSSQLIWIKYF